MLVRSHHDKLFDLRVFMLSLTLCSCQCHSPIPHQLTSIPYDAHQSASLNTLGTTSREPPLNLSQPLEPCDASLRRHFELLQLIGERGENVGQGQALARFEHVHSVETGGNVAGGENGGHDFLDVGRVRGSNAVVNRRVGDGLGLGLSGI